jgi:hypothetical protein
MVRVLKALGWALLIAFFIMGLVIIAANFLGMGP